MQGKAYVVQRCKGRLRPLEKPCFRAAEIHAQALRLQNGFVFMPGNILSPLAAACVEQGTGIFVLRVCKERGGRLHNFAVAHHVNRIRKAPHHA